MYKPITMQRILFYLVLILSTVIVATGAALAQSPPPPQVRVALAKQRLMAPQVRLPGTVISRNDARIAAEIAGRVAWVAEVGTVLKKGAEIARLDDHLLQLQLKNDQATIRRLQASLTYQTQDVARIKELAARNSAPVSRLEQAVSQRDMTREDLTQARIARDQTLYMLEKTHVRAPFPGRIVERLLKPGEYSTVGRQVARLSDGVHLEVRVPVPVALAPYLHDGLTASVVAGGQTIEGQVRAVIPVADEVTRMFEVRIAVPAQGLVTGSAAQVGLPNGTARQVIAVPRDALILRREATYVFRIGDDDIAHRIVVRTGAAEGRFIEISGPVKDGERVVVRGGERLRDGQKVSAEPLS